MKKVLAVCLAVMLSAGVAFACEGPGCLNTSSTNNGLYPNTAAPNLMNYGPALGNAGGGWNAGGAGNIGIDAYAQGTNFTVVDALAIGTVSGKGFAGGIETPHFGMGASGALATTTLFGVGSAYGDDTLVYDTFNIGRRTVTLPNNSQSANPDFASVRINYSGIATQGNGIGVGNGDGTWISAGNHTTASFGGGSYVDSYGRIQGFFCFPAIDVGIPAFAVNADGGMGYAAGFTIGGYIDVPNFASAHSFTGGVSGYFADYGQVSGQGQAFHQAVAKGSENGSYGISAAQAEFCYNGHGNFGAGYAKTGGSSVVINGAHSTTVISTSHAQSGSMVSGNQLNQPN